MGLLSDVGDAGLGMLAAFWLSTIVAVGRDASARIANAAGVRAAVALAVVVPFVGAFVWFCLRPLEPRLERRERRLLVALAERELAESSLDSTTPKRALAHADAEHRRHPRVTPARLGARSAP